MKRAVVSLFLAAVMASLGVLVAERGSHTATAIPPLTFSDVVRQCSNSVGSDGFGSATVDRDLAVLNQSDTLSTPCIIHLANGATITINNSQLKTAHVLVTDEGASGHGSVITIQHSTLIGAGQSGLLVRLVHASDRVTLEESTIDYPLSVWVLVMGLGSGSDADGGYVEAIGSTFRSNDPGSQGIRLVAGPGAGVGNFVNDTFQTPYSFGLALLLAGTCHEQRIQGAPRVCSLRH